MKSNLAIATLIRSRMTELDLSRGEFAKRLGYRMLQKAFAGSTPCVTATSTGQSNFWTLCPKPWRHRPIQ